MERPACKLCHRRFPNGRALGGHMRSHVAAGAAAPARPRVLLLPDSSASSASASDGEDEDGKGSGQSYGLRENPKKSFRLVDPEFSSSFVAAMYTGSSAAVVLQDGESETESPHAEGPPCHRRRSKRPRPSTVCPPPPQAEPEPVSSVSDATPEEDVAVSLMMLSRDVWTRSSSVDGGEQQQQLLLQSEAADDQIAGAGSRGLYEPEQEESDEQKRTKFQCETCRKVFKSYQALGGHRASHKKLKQSCARATPDQFSIPSDANADRGGSSSKVHECPICLRVFGSGQALGGHKRSHLCYATAASYPSIPPPPIPQAKSPMIDLNLPAPIEDEAAELSVVSDAEFLTSQH